MVQVLPAPTTWARSVLPLWRMRQTAFFLMRGQIAVAQQLARHAGKGQMRAVEFAQTQIVEAVVIVAGQPRRARSSSSQTQVRNRSLSCCCFSRAAMVSC